MLAPKDISSHQNLSSNLYYYNVRTEFSASKVGQAPHSQQPCSSAWKWVVQIDVWAQTDWVVVNNRKRVSEALKARRQHGDARTEGRRATNLVSEPTELDVPSPMLKKLTFYGCDNHISTFHGRAIRVRLHDMVLTLEARSTNSPHLAQGAHVGG